VGCLGASEWFWCRRSSILANAVEAKRVSDREVAFSDFVNAVKAKQGSEKGLHSRYSPVPRSANIIVSKQASNSLSQLGDYFSSIKLQLQYQMSWMMS
jgi:3-methyladenine DNA glycosylase Tag